MPSITIPTRVGYAFGGYYSGPYGSGTQYYTASGASTRSWNNTVPMTLYAKWTVITYRVTLDRQGGSGGSASATTVYGEDMPSITLPTHTGYTFGGYYTGENGSGTQYYTASGTSARSWDKTAATTLYAKWTAKTYDVTLDRQGGSGGSTSVKAVYGSAMPAITLPTRTGYTFGGYYTATGGSGTQYYTSSGTSARSWDKTAATTLYAKWTLTPTHTVTLDRQGGSGGTESVTAVYGESMPAITVPTRTGYTFGGYYTATGGSGVQYYTATGTSARSWDGTAATTLYAKWTAKSYTVTLDRQGGSGGSTSTTAVYGSAMPTITLPTRTGYAFGGYYTAKNGGGTQYYKASGASARNWDKTAATTLYAKWTAKTYTLTFDANGGTHSSSTQTATATYDGALPDCIPAPTNDEDCSFCGWASDQAGTNLWYGPDGTKLLPSYTTAADTTLYAVWKPATPVIVPADGTILSGSQSVVISCATAGATIHFTTNGAVPTAESPVYRRFRVSQRMTVKAVAVKDGLCSAVAVAEFALGRCADPVIAPSDGTAFWHSGLSVTIAWAGEDGVLRYTLDGSEPTQTSPVYGGPFTIDETTVVKARAFGDQFFDSAVVTATLTRGWRMVATPVVRAAASFTGTRTPVEIDCATPGATIRYTMDGSTPDSRSPRYAGRFHVSDSCTVKAYAVLEDYDDSAVASFAIEKIRGIGDTMGDPDRTFATGGTLPFFRVADSSAPSGESMKSGAIAHNGTSTLSTTVDGPGTFSFRWKTSCEDSEGYYDWDRAEFRVDGALAAQLDGQTDWRTFSRAVSGAGPHALEWRYVKDDMGSEGQDCCWVADFSWAPSCTETTEVPVPHGWLLGFYPDTPDKRDSYEAVAKSSAANGKNKVWECYLAGTSPTDAENQFLAEIVMDENGNPQVTWTPDLGGARDYAVEGKPSLADDWGAPDADSRFFRVHVAMPGGFDQQTITFDSAGGTSVSSITAPYGATLSAPQPPTKQGYAFAGWSPAFPETMPFGGVSLVAHWTATLSTALNSELTFSTGGDAEWFAESDDTHDGEDAARSGRIGNGQTSWLETTVTGPGTISFWWKAVTEYADFDWYVSTMDRMAFRVDDAERKNLVCGNGATWTRESFSIDGDGEHVLRWVFTKRGDGDPETYCGWVDEIVWTPTSQYTITFDSAGGSAVASITAYSGSALTAPVAPTKNGYSFAGWSPAFPSTMPIGGATLTAQWTPKTASVSFDAQGGSGGTSSATATYGSAMPTITVPTRMGYDFGGYWTEVNGGGTQYYTASGSSARNWDKTAPTTLYGKWTTKTYSATYIVVDLSDGPSASGYPVSEMSGPPSGGWTDEYKTTKLVLRKIQAGQFTMGSPSSELGHGNYETQHRVTISQSFYMGVFEVTQRQYELVMGGRPSFFSNDSHYASRPVEKVSFADIRGSSSGSQWPSSSMVDATSFMGKIRTKTGIESFDLPTEAQWEYACRAGTTTALNSGKNLTSTYSDPNLDEVGRNFSNGFKNGSSSSCDTNGGTAKVGSYLPNAWGLYDMHGNVVEWCLDWWQSNLGTSTATDPPGAASGSDRVYRSGSWNSNPNECRSAFRFKTTPSVRNSAVGFRICCSSAQ